MTSTSVGVEQLLALYSIDRRSPVALAAYELAAWIDVDGLADHTYACLAELLARLLDDITAEHTTTKPLRSDATQARQLAALFN